MDWTTDDLLRVLPQKDTAVFERVGLRPVKLVSIPVAELKQQYMYDTAYDHLLRDGNGNVDRSILNSPHFKALTVYKRHGIMELRRRFKTLDFYKMHQHWNAIGFKLNLMTSAKIPIQKSDEAIWARLLALISAYESIRKFGYARGKFQGQYITVLEVPFEVTRFGRQFDWEPYEIWSGHHRAAALATLGFQEATVVLLEDIRKIEQPW